MPFRVVNPQHVAITVAFKRQGGQATYSMTRNGHIRMEIWNCTEGIMHIAPRAIMVHIWGENIGIRKLGEKWKNANVIDVGSLTPLSFESYSDCYVLWVYYSKRQVNSFPTLG